MNTNLNWGQQKIGSFFKLLSGFPFPSKYFSNLDGFPLIRIRDITDSKIETYFQGHFSPTFVIRQGDVLIGMDGDFNLTRWKNNDALLNQRVLKVDVCDTQKLDLTFIYYWLQPYIKKVNDITAATTVKHLSTKDLIKAEGKIPKISIQRKIGGILETIDQAIEKTEALIEKYQHIKAGLMRDLFTRGITADGKLRPPREQAPELYQETPIDWIPKDWKFDSLKRIFGSANIVNGPFGSDLLTSELKKEGIPVLYCQDIKTDAFTRVSKSHVSIYKALQLSFCNVRKYDILLSKVGSPPCDSCVYDNEIKAIVTQDVIRIRPSTEHNSEFFSSWFNSTHGRKAIKKIAIEGTRERVSLGEFKELILPIPPNLEQNEIGQRLIKIQNLISLEKDNLIKLTNQKSGLMHDLLTGKVQVKVDDGKVIT